MFKSRLFRVDAIKMNEAIEESIPLIKQLSLDTSESILLVDKLYKSKTGNLWQK